MVDREITYYWCNIGKQYPTEPFESCGSEGCTKPYPDTFPDFCSECREMELTTKEEKWMSKKVIDRLGDIGEQKVKIWNDELQPIKNGVEFWKRKQEFLNHLFPEIEYVFRLVLKEGSPNPLPPETLFYGRKCLKCGRTNLWAFIAVSDLEIKPRKILEKCPKCGEQGSEYIDKRGFIYFQHYREGKRKVCYIGKVEE